MTKEAVIFLFIAIVVEVIATISLKLSDSFTRLVPSIVTIIGYCIAFWCLTIPMRTIPAGIIYAIWSGVGIVLIGLIGWLFLGQKLDVPAIIGMLLIICGVIVINLFSKSVSHQAMMMVDLSPHSLCGLGYLAHYQYGAFRMTHNGCGVGPQQIGSNIRTMRGDNHHIGR